MVKGLSDGNEWMKEERVIGTDGLAWLKKVSKGESLPHLCVVVRSLSRRVGLFGGPLSSAEENE